MTDLGTLGGSSSGAGDINDNGQVVGKSGNSADPVANTWSSGLSIPTARAELE